MHFIKEVYILEDFYDNYRLIEAAKVRSVNRINDGIEITPEAMVVKIERNNGAEDYYDGFKDYHEPK